MDLCKQSILYTKIIDCIGELESISAEAFHRASRYEGIRVYKPLWFMDNFSKRPIKGQRSKVIQRLFVRNALWLPNVFGVTIDQSVILRRSLNGRPGSTMAQLEMTNQIERTPDQSVIF